MPRKTKLEKEVELGVVGSQKRKIKIGVMGSASGPTLHMPEVIERCREVGREIARHNCILINGACPGLPHEAVLGAKEECGFTLGISPAFSEHEHLQEYKSPIACFDFILFSGMGFMERDIVNIRASDAIIFLGGGIGTVNEFTVAYEEGKPIGVLTDSGGFSTHFRDMVKNCDRDIEPNMVFESDPHKLIKKLLQVARQHPHPVHEDGRVKDVKFGAHRG